MNAPSHDDSGFPPEPAFTAFLSAICFTNAISVYSFLWHPYSHSIVPGGLDATSQTTRLLPRRRIPF
jgi:hypothetical protein